jgi:hypothetical protein
MYMSVKFFFMSFISVIYLWNVPEPRQLLVVRTSKDIYIYIYIYIYREREREREAGNK